MKTILNKTERKPLAAPLGEYTNTEPQYLRAPPYGCWIGDPLLAREGNVEGPDTVSQVKFDELLVILNVSGYCPKKTDSHLAQKSEAETTSIGETGLTTTIPFENVNVENPTNPLDAKGFLIKHALHIDDLRFELSEDSISFPRFSELPEPDEAHVYGTLIAVPCKISKNQKRINVTEKLVDNERCAFRCSLLRLGSVGDECKTDRKILIKYLPGNGVFKGGEGHAISK